MAQITLEGNRWLVSGDMTMAQVDSLLSASAVLPITLEVEIDLAQVAEVDSVAISLLFEWLRQACARKSKVTYSNLPQNLVSLATLYGVFELIPQAKH